MTRPARRQPLRIEYVALARLKPDPKNPRRISAEARKRLRGGLERFGNVQPIIARRRDGRIVGGHQRYAIERERGSARVPVVFLDDINDRELRALNLLLNNPEAQGDWDLERLTPLLTDLQAHGIDLALTGFGEETLTQLLDASLEDVAETTLAPPKRPRSKPGQVYALGPHRLLCGRAEDSAAVGRMLQGDQAACVFTDPPYGVDYDAPSGKHARIVNDDKRRDQLAMFLQEAFTTLVRCARDDAAFYIWHASSTRRDFETAMTAAGLLERQYLIWQKPGLVLGWADYQWAHEPCFYAAKAGCTPAFHGDRTETTTWRLTPAVDGKLAIVIDTSGVLLSDGRGQTIQVTLRAPKGKAVRHVRVPAKGSVTLTPSHDTDDLWEVRRDAKPDHPTQKPIALARRAIANSSLRGELVLDVFAGSGNTLLAADELGRRAALVELEPAYCDVIRQRYADRVQDASLSPVGKVAA